MFSILIIGVIIREEYKLQNFGNVNVAMTHKIFYGQSCYPQLFFIGIDKRSSQDNINR